jgi:3-oxoacyl-[acyl-carrier protein] reductase
MDLGLQGKRALVCASSKGLGYACAHALKRAGCHVLITARTAGPLAEAEARLAALAEGEVQALVADVTSTAGRSALLAAMPAPDILITNAAGPKPGDVRGFTEADWLAAVHNNMLTPLALINAVIDGMVSRRFGRIINITSAMVKSASDTLALSNGARAGLTGAVAGLARQVAAHNVTINNLLPGLFATERGLATVDSLARARNLTHEQAMAARLAGIPARRIGQPEEFGDLCAFVASAQAGYITGQNLTIDGGAFPGIFG